mmetsp:Transcript_19878/g.31193  ORF Transcript_19878/g.31193 Transcript_19878/m.31193 type:complete len:283 (+) Transcript_19878:344-1192(+)
MSFRLHLLKHLICFSHVIVAQACAHQRALYSGVGFQSILSITLLDDFKCLAQLFPTSVHLDENAHCDVRRFDIMPFHVCQDLVCNVHPLVPHASIDQCVIHRIIAFATFAQLRKNLEGFLDVAFDHIAFNDSRVCDRIRLATQFLHSLNQLNNLLCSSLACLSINQRGENISVQLHSFFFHLLIKLHGLIGFVILRQAFDECGIHERIHWNRMLPFVEERESVVQGIIANQCVHHASKHVVARCGFLLLGHRLPEVPTLIDLTKSTASLDEQSVCVYRWTKI